MTPAFKLARSIQTRVARLKSYGYSHPPIREGEDASFHVWLPTGQRLKVIVKLEDGL